jgi:adhesin transport system membrane fusion protein
MEIRRRPSHREIAFMSEVDGAIYRRGSTMAYLLSTTIVLMLAVFIFWAHHAVLDEVTRGDGQAIPSQQVQVIQNLEGGILDQILVQENQIIERGDVLVRLDNTTAASQFQDAYAKALGQEAAIARLEAEVAGRPIQFPDNLLADRPQLAQDQRTIMKARRRQLDLELKILETEAEQKTQEIAEIEGRLADIQQRLELADEQLAIAQPLVKKGLYAKVDFIKLQREVMRLKGELNALTLSLPRVRKEAEEARQKMEQRRAAFRAEALDELSQRRVVLNSLREVLTAGEDRVTRTDVRSPVRGMVKQIIINTIGGVVRPGDPILEIVPLDDSLLFEVRIRPADIAFLYPGQRAMIKISAYDFSIYGGLEGVVEQISVDTIRDERGESYYKVKLRTHTNAITHRGSKLPIIPGMTASVDILTGKKTVLEYLLKPILKASQNALRER